MARRTLLGALTAVLLLLGSASAASNRGPLKAQGRALLGNPFNYGDVLGLSYLFYEAQRSGKLPGDQRVKWRGDSALNDKGPGGEDLTGGYYDAGDYVKFGMPAAFTTGVMAWTLVEFKQGVSDAGQYGPAFQALRWGADYLMKAALGEDRVVAQVGDGQSDHNLWRRAEDVTEARPVSVCDPSKPGSDVAGAMAGALAATAVAFKGSDDAYAAAALGKAKQLYNFANKYRGYYHSACAPSASNFYNSKSYNDDLAWAAIWLYKASGDGYYLSQAQQHYKDHRAGDSFNNWNSRKYGFFWDSYSPAVALLLAQQTGDADAWGHYRGFLDAWTSGRSNGDVVVSPQGFSWYTKDQGWGSLRHMGGAAFLALVGAKGDSGEARDKAVCWAHGQIAYALGDAGRSYVVGFGSNPPQRPHHRGASCPDAPAPCNYNAVWAPGANPRTITGALVGGPNDKDEYTDDRGDARSNEVAIDYNAGFTGALAGLKQAPIDYAACKAKGLGRQKRG